MIPKCDLWGDCATLVHNFFSMGSFVHFGHSSSHLLLGGEDHSGLAESNDSFIKWSIWHIQKPFMTFNIWKEPDNVVQSRFSALNTSS